MKTVPSRWMSWNARAAALGCAFWQPSRIRPSLARFLTVSACRRGPLLLLPPGATDKTHSLNFDGRPTAFADVCFQAGCFRVWFEGRRVQIFVRPEIPLRNSFPDAPKSSSARLRCRISAHAPEKNRFRFSYALPKSSTNRLRLLTRIYIFRATLKTVCYFFATVVRRNPHYRCVAF